MREGFIAVAVLAVLMLGANVVLRRSQGSAVPGNVPSIAGRLIIRPPRRNAVLFGITSLVPAALLGALTLRSWGLGRTGPVGLVLGIVATAAVLGFAAYQFAYASRARLLVGDTGIERVGVSRRRLVAWGAISKIAFNPHHHWFFVTVSDGSHLWLPADVAGMPQFARLAVRRLPAGVLQADASAREVLEELAGAAGEDAPRDLR